MTMNKDEARKLALETVAVQVMGLCRAGDHQPGISSSFQQKEAL